MEWSSPKKPAEITEERLIEAILNGTFPINSSLPGERELAVQLGVTRPTLREAMQRLARDGWLEINQGKATRVCNYLEEGNLAVLAMLVDKQGNLPENFVRNLLEVRELMAPAYTKSAIGISPDEVGKALEECLNLPENAEDYAIADWQLHHRLTIASGNPVFTLILNGFKDLYLVMGKIYFKNPAGREASRQFYSELLESIEAGKPEQAGSITLDAMRKSTEFWNAAPKG